MDHFGNQNIMRQTEFIPLCLQLQTRLLAQQDQHVPVGEILVCHGKKKQKKEKIFKKEVRAM